MTPTGTDIDVYVGSALRGVDLSGWVVRAWLRVGVTKRKKKSFDICHIIVGDHPLDHVGHRSDIFSFLVKKSGSEITTE